MFKHASRNLQRRVTHIASVQPAYISDDDLIPTAGNMNIRECEEERAKITLEMTRAQNELIAARATGDHRTVATLGNRLQACCQRVAVLKQRRLQLLNTNEYPTFKQAVRELVPPDLLAKIYERHSELRAEAVGE